MEKILSISLKLNFKSFGLLWVEHSYRAKEIARSTFKLFLKCFTIS